MQLEICPKCSCRHPVPVDICPHCGVIYAKVAEVDARRSHEEVSTPPGRMGQLLFAAKGGENVTVIGIKAVFLAVLSLYGVKLIRTPILAFPDSGWWLHGVNLVFHEAGHVLFMPFGRFVHLLGGTLGQLLVPAVVTGAFLRRRDIFGAVVGTWWLGENFLDSAPYINDARALQLMLLGGVTGSEVEDYHDWEGVLGRMGMLQYDHTLARIAFTTGSVLMLAAMVWGCYILWKEYAGRYRS